MSLVIQSTRSVCKDFFSCISWRKQCGGLSCSEGPFIIMSMTTLPFRLSSLLILSLASTMLADEQSDVIRKVESALPPHVGACVLALDRGKVIFEHASGLADVESQTPCT